MKDWLSKFYGNLNDAFIKINSRLGTLSSSKEDKSNKSTTLDNPDNTSYPTTKAVSDAISSIPTETPTLQQVLDKDSVLNKDTHVWAQYGDEYGNSLHYDVIMNGVKTEFSGGYQDSEERSNIHKVMFNHNGMEIYGNSSSDFRLASYEFKFYSGSVPEIQSYDSNKNGENFNYTFVFPQKSGGSEEKGLSLINIGEGYTAWDYPKKIKYNNKDTNISSVDVDGGSVKIYSESPDGWQEINLGEGPIVVSDSLGNTGLTYDLDYSEEGSLNDRWIPDWASVKEYADQIGKLPPIPHKHDMSDINGLSAALDSKVDKTTTVVGGGGITIGGSLESGQVSIAINDTYLNNKYLRKDINDNNGTNTLTVGKLETPLSEIEELRLPSLSVGSNDDQVLIVGADGVVKKKSPQSDVNIGVSNSTGVDQFHLGADDSIRFAGTGDTSVSFNPETKTVTITSTPGAGGGGAVTSFNGRTGGVVAEEGDYSTNQVIEEGNLYFTEPRVRATPLSGISFSSSQKVVATDNVLQGIGKLQAQMDGKASSGNTLTVSGTAGRIIVGGGEQDLTEDREWQVDLVQTGVSTGTYTKVSVDSYGRVTVGGSLIETDIPALSASKIESGVLDIARIPTGTTGTTVALGNHTHTFAQITNKPTTIAGYGITDAYTKSEVNGLIPAPQTLSQVDLSDIAISGGNTIALHSLRARGIGWDVAQLARGYFNTGSQGNPLGGSSVVHGVVIPHGGNTSYGTSLVFRNNRGWFQSLENGSLKPWVELWHNGNLRSNEQNDERYWSLGGNNINNLPGSGVHTLFQASTQRWFGAIYNGGYGGISWFTRVNSDNTGFENSHATLRPAMIEYRTNELRFRRGEAAPIGTPVTWTDYNIYHTGNLRSDTQNDERYLQLSGGTVTGVIKSPAPVVDADLANKKYVDDNSAIEAVDVSGVNGYRLRGNVTTVGQNAFDLSENDERYSYGHLNGATGKGSVVIGGSKSDNFSRIIASGENSIVLGGSAASGATISATGKGAINIGNIVGMGGVSEVSSGISIGVDIGNWKVVNNGMTLLGVQFSGNRNHELTGRGVIISSLIEGTAIQSQFNKYTVVGARLGWGELNLGAGEINDSSSNTAILGGYHSQGNSLNYVNVNSSSRGGVIIGGYEPASTSTPIINKKLHGYGAVSLGGTGLQSYSYGAVTLGVFNDPITTRQGTRFTPSDPILIVGNGEGDEDRNNSYVLFGNGKSQQEGIAEYMSNLHSQYTDRTLVDKEYVDSIVGKVWMPDYDSQETTNRISTPSGSWTVPEGYVGWVNCFVWGYSETDLDAEMIKINGKTVGRAKADAPQSATSVSASVNGIFPVKGGDVVKFNNNSTSYCYFIPGIWV